MLNSYLDCFSLSPVRPMLLSWIIFLYVFSLILRFHPQTPKETPKTLRGCDDTTGTGGCRWDFPGMTRETAKPTGVNIVI